jgi:hypothetical protein
MAFLAAGHHKTRGKSPGLYAEKRIHSPSVGARSMCAGSFDLACSNVERGYEHDVTFDVARDGDQHKDPRDDAARGDNCDNDRGAQAPREALLRRADLRQLHHR